MPPLYLLPSAQFQKTKTKEDIIGNIKNNRIKREIMDMFI